LEVEQILLILAIVGGAYMAWNIGANDVANAMGTSVGSKALTLLGAVVVAAVFEFAGAFFVGNRVTSTIAKGIISLDAVVGHELELACGMAAALFAAAIWLNVASRLGWPVSTTHSIVGAVIGFGLVLAGAADVQWGGVGKIVLSWIISPLSGALLAVAVYWLLVLPIYRSREPATQLRRIVPPATGMVFFLLALSMFYKGLKNLHLDLPVGEALIMAAVVGIIAAGVAHALIIRRPLENDVNLFMRFKQTEPVFAVLQVITACYMAFAHGANDVANSVGPLAAVVAVVSTGAIAKEAAVPLWVLALGGVGIVIGLATYGHRVIATVGRKITSITPSRGFSAEFGCATTVLICSKLGLPVSTTHTLVGAVVGVGLARGIRGLDLRVVRDIALSWLVTIPFTAVLTVLLYLLIRWLVL
jgi:PiT family inorganic phosphate transporter